MKNIKVGVPFYFKGCKVVKQCKRKSQVFNWFHVEIDGQQVKTLDYEKSINFQRPSSNQVDILCSQLTSCVYPK